MKSLAIAVCMFFSILSFGQNGERISGDDSSRSSRSVSTRESNVTLSALMDSVTALRKELNELKREVAATKPATPAPKNDMQEKQTPPAVNNSDVYYVDGQKGVDSNPGTIDLPFKTLDKAWFFARPGVTIFLREGIYEPRNPRAYSGFKFANRSGAENNMIKIWAYPGEKVTFDLGKMSMTADNPQGITINSNYIHLKGVEITNLPQLVDASGRGTQPVGMVIYGNYNIIEGCKVHDIGGIGITIGGSAINTLILNCDVYRCYDPKTYSNSGEPYPGGNADGIHITYSGLNSTATIRGCRIWDNSDDGIDCFNTDGHVIIENTWCIRNGYIPGTRTKAGDGSGFKLGRTTTTYGEVKRTVVNCVAALNREQGFTQNGATCGIQLFNNTSYKNGLHQFDFGNKSQFADKIVLKNNLACGNPSNYTPLGEQTHNTWDSKVMVTDADFKSVDVDLLLSPRKPNGNLPDVSTFKLAAGSDLLGAATNVGYGKNIGAF
ncbi:MAG TPA: right-handed parallel beta-helix repeat-containing protein [Bacteroidales bacterium]|nr:right-handed parallel beta-helix repeat-containing protein [Bacteroidales bacterium]